jgi:hypothetical protein
MQEYLEKHNLKDIEDIAQHIVELKRNTVPDLGLISSLCSYVFSAENRINISDFLTVVQEKENHKKQESLNKEISGTTFINDFLKAAVEGENKKISSKPSVHCGGYDKPKFTNSTRHKSQNGETHGLSTNSKCQNKDGCFCSGKCNNNQTFNQSLNIKDFTTPTLEQNQNGKKEEDGKLTYELDWEFVEQLANRMAKNKGKYKPYNWKQPIDVEKLKQSLLRHVVEIMKGNYEDDNNPYGHILSVALNAMFINYQLKLNKS